MRKQIAAANWKMNLTYQQAEKLLDDILDAKVELTGHQLAIFAVPFPYLILANSEVANTSNYFIAAILWLCAPLSGIRSTLPFLKCSRLYYHYRQPR